jgi:hypothetical protein
LPKKWVILNERKGLVKFANDGQDLIEITANIIGRKMGLDMAETKLVMMDGKYGNISFNVLRDGETLMHAIDILKLNENKFKTIYNPSEKNEIKIKRGFEHIFDAFENLGTGNIYDSMKRSYIKMVLFDCFIGNPSRGPRNWGVIKTKNIYKLSPIFDNDCGYDYGNLVWIGFEEAHAETVIKYIFDNYFDDIKKAAENMQKNITPEFIAIMFESMDKQNKNRLDFKQFLNELLLRRDFILSEYKDKSMGLNQTPQNNYSKPRIKDDYLSR